MAKKIKEVLDTIGKKITGSKIELILTKKIDNTHYECWIKANRVDIGNEYVFEKGLKCKLIGVKKDIFIVEFNKKIRKNLVDEIFELPLPPYVKRKIDDEREYQTVYSKKQGSLAAPTAGLHFTDDLLKKIKKKGVKIAKICLHIDFGTFLTIKGNIEEHKMHEEYFEITKQAADIINNRKARLIVVGTTSVRALEASSKNGKILAKKAKTDIFIYPGYEFKNKIDALITNFHLPKSTLLMLVSAYYGMDSILKAYKEAVKKKYRFYSLGDAMLLIK